MQRMEVTSWAGFKTLVQSKALLPQYTSEVNAYELYAPEGYFLWHLQLIKDGGADVTEFEADYQSTYNKPLEIKAGPGRPIRTAPSPQPINTTQKWKGYQVTLGVGETSTYVDITFSGTVYVKGGVIHCDSLPVNCYSNVDAILVEYEMVVMEGLLDHVYLHSNSSLPFQSAEAMAIGPEIGFRLYLKNDTPMVTAATVSIVVEYFE